MDSLASRVDSNAAGAAIKFDPAALPAAATSGRHLANRLARRAVDLFQSLLMERVISIRIRL
jgi:hypothetical protein